MSSIFPELPLRLGDYTLSRLLSARENSELYEATQSHVERSVIIEVLRPDCDQHALNAFLNTARARVATNPPRVGQVFESLMAKGFWYLAQEKPAGRSLATRLEQGASLTPLETCAVIIAAAELYAACTRQQRAAAPLLPDSIFLSDKGDIAFLSPVVAGKPRPEAVPLQMRELAFCLRPLLPRSGPGCNRVSTLVLWLQEGYEGQWLEWPSIQSTAALIVEQLTPPRQEASARQRPQTTGSRRRAILRRWRRNLRRSGWVAASAAIIAAIAYLGSLFPLSSPAELAPLQGEYVACQLHEKTVRVLAHPVTRREYRDFLQAYDSMSASRKAALHRDTPPEHADPRPAGWDASDSAQPEDAPVTNVSYWNALAYARSLGGELPPIELLAAVRQETGEEPAIQEWTASTHPDSGVYRESALILPPGENPAPLLEPERAARSPQRGFRILLDTSSTPSNA